MTPIIPGEELANATMRLLVEAAQFHDLIDNIETKTISRDGMHVLIKKAAEVSKRALSFEEVENFTDFAYSRVAQREGLAALSSHKDAPTKESGIQFDHFAHSMARDVVIFPDVERVFNSKRNRSRLERIFTPEDLEYLRGRRPEMSRREGFQSEQRLGGAASPPGDDSPMGSLLSGPPMASETQPIEASKTQPIEASKSQPAEADQPPKMLSRSPASCESLEADELMATVEESLASLTANTRLPLPALAPVIAKSTGDVPAELFLPGSEQAELRPRPASSGLDLRVTLPYAARSQLEPAEANEESRAALHSLGFEQTPLAKRRERVERELEGALGES